LFWLSIFSFLFFSFLGSLLHGWFVHGIRVRRAVQSNLFSWQKMVMCSRAPHFRALAEVVGCVEWLDDPRLPGPLLKK
jgi:hypothetical protein